MRRTFALLWLLAVGIAAGYLAYRLSGGLAFRTDLMALLPQDEQNPAQQQASEIVAQAVNRLRNGTPYKRPIGTPFAGYPGSA